MSYENKSSAELEREVEAQRHQVESRIGEIKQRLSPGQLIDEALAYTKDGGSHFASNLGQTIAANPLPAVMLGVSLAWLMSGQGPKLQQHHESHAHRPSSGTDYPPYAQVSGSGVRRTRHAADETGQWWSEFETGDGGRYKAKSNEKGHRLGHFVDDTGKFFSGFIDNAGNRIKHFQDESGNMLDEATGWASHTWSDMQQNLTQGAQQITSTAKDLGREMQKQTDHLTRQIGTLFEQQPLIAGALAFAAGAALGAALPHTREEDKLVGEAGDKLRREAGHMAGDLYEKGKEQVGEAYEQVAAKAGEAYDDVKGKIGQFGTDGSGSENQTGTGQGGSYSRH